MGHLQSIKLKPFLVFKAYNIHYTFTFSYQTEHFYLYRNLCVPFKRAISIRYIMTDGIMYTLYSVQCTLYIVQGTRYLRPQRFNGTCQYMLFSNIVLLLNSNVTPVTEQPFLPSYDLIKTSSQPFTVFT